MAPRSALISTHLYSQVAYDVRYALNHAPIAVQLVSDGGLLPLLLRSLALTQGMHPLRRRLLTHVEREEHTWADAFSLSAELAQLLGRRPRDAGPAEAKSLERPEPLDL